MVNLINEGFFWKADKIIAINFTSYFFCFFNSKAALIMSKHRRTFSTLNDEEKKWVNNKS